MSAVCIVTIEPQIPIIKIFSYKKFKIISHSFNFKIIFNNFLLLHYMVFGQKCLDHIFWPFFVRLLCLSTVYQCIGTSIIFLVHCCHYNLRKNNKELKKYLISVNKYIGLLHRDILCIFSAHKSNSLGHTPSASSPQLILSSALLFHICKTFPHSLLSLFR